MFYDREYANIYFVGDEEDFFVMSQVLILIIEEKLEKK